MGKQRHDDVKEG